MIQNKTARLILQCPYRTNINQMHFDLQWLKVEERMIAAILLSSWKVLHIKALLDQYNKLQSNVICNSNINMLLDEQQRVDFYFLMPKLMFLNVQ